MLSMRVNKVKIVTWQFDFSSLALIILISLLSYLFSIMRLSAQFPNTQHDYLF